MIWAHCLLAVAQVIFVVHFCLIRRTHYRWCKSILSSLEHKEALEKERSAPKPASTNQFKKNSESVPYHRTNEFKLEQSQRKKEWWAKKKAAESSEKTLAAEGQTAKASEG